MKTTLENVSSIKTIDLGVENIRSRRAEAQLQYYNKYIDEIIKSLNLRWYQKLYLKFMLLIK
ncbi:hypothetical protein H9X90_05825 [Faecalicatena contorta]|uniref:hypothetical protein n=1 Tax=Faecalicatena contorta TaxID=39482 RepID=UPI001961F102|nr:hypothetical protein [Faecalicatena contorta]MBM6685519.1 hypothetical protein [Faecalicatena contorta]MBM6710262.1 hypothetical protein [Faecalicatena contorta]